jgi:hypothetical protein
MAKTYKFYLKFDDDKKSLSRLRGLSLKELHVLLKAIDDVTNLGDNSFISISNIEEGSYMPVIVTDSEPRYNKLLKVHQDLEIMSFDELPKEELKYAETLIRNLLGEDRFLESYDNDQNLVSKVTGKEIGKEIDSYNAITTISGVISEIGAKSLQGKTHIEIHDLGYRIFTTPEQDIALKQFYRDGKVSFKIKQKITTRKKKVASASLLDFKPSKKGSLMENLNALTQDALLIVKDIHSHEEVLRLIRES